MNAKHILGAWVVAAGLLAAGCHNKPAAGWSRYEAAKSRHEAAVSEIERLGGRVASEGRGHAVELYAAGRDKAERVLALLPDIIDLDSVTLVGTGATYEQRRQDVARLRERYDAWK